MITIAHLNSLVTIIDVGSFTKAANRLHRSQPAISIHIKDLEQELSVNLFHRFGPMKAKPTQDAQILARLVRPLLHDFETIKDRFNEVRGSYSNAVISVASHDSVISYLLPDIAAHFKEKYKIIDFRFSIGSKEDIIRKVVDAEVDFGITTLNDVPPGIIYSDFATHKRVLLLPKKHKISTLKTIKAKDIANHPLILPPPGNETRILVDNFFKSKDITYNISLELTGKDAVKKYVERGFGIAVMSDYYVEESDKKNIVVKDVSHLFGTTHRGILYRKGKVLSSVQKEFLDQFKSLRT